MLNNLEKELEEKIANAKSEEEVIQIFSDAGLSVTLDQLNAEQVDGELYESALDAVSGGGLYNVVRNLWARYQASRYNAGGGGYASGGGGAGSGGGGGGGGR